MQYKIGDKISVVFLLTVEDCDDVVYSDTNFPTEPWVECSFGQETGLNQKVILSQSFIDEHCIKRKCEKIEKAVEVYYSSKDKAPPGVYSTINFMMGEFGLRLSSQSSLKEELRIKFEEVEKELKSTLDYEVDFKMAGRVFESLTDRRIGAGMAISLLKQKLGIEVQSFFEEIF